MIIFLFVCFLDAPSSLPRWGHWRTFIPWCHCFLYIEIPYEQMEGLLLRLLWLSVLMVLEVLIMLLLLLLLMLEQLWRRSPGRVP